MVCVKREDDPTTWKRREVRVCEQDSSPKQSKLEACHVLDGELS